MKKFYMFRENKNFAFTLSEVLITLGIIGVVAALTLPVITSEIQKLVLKNQFKKAYNTFSNAVIQTQASMEEPIRCFYWQSDDLKPECNLQCTGHDKYGDCNSYQCEDGSNLPPNLNGEFSDCSRYYNELFGKNLKVIKYCNGEALANGCITDKYKGIDKVRKEQNPDKEFQPNGSFTDNAIKNDNHAWLLSNGILILEYGSSTTPIFTIDINGHKAPNKWGYDLFTFELAGSDGITKLIPLTYAIEKGGRSTAKMLEEMNK